MMCNVFHSTDAHSAEADVAHVSRQQRKEKAMQGQCPILALAVIPTSASGIGGIP
jgi:hypothetical protein